MIDGLACVASESASSDLFYGPSSTIAFLRTLSDATSTSLGSMRRTSKRDSDTKDDPFMSNASREDSQHQANERFADSLDPLALPDENVAFRLIDIFFQGPGTLYPFLHEQAIRTRFSNAVNKGPGRFTPSFLALINAVFALASSCGHNPPDTFDPVHKTSHLFFQRAKALLDFHHRHSKPTLESVQCLVVMCLYKQGTQSSLDTCDLYGRRAIQMAIQIGLHDRDFPSQLSPLESQIRKRTWMTCVVLDRVLSMAFGRPRDISAQVGRLEHLLNESLDDLSVPPESVGKDEHTSQISSLHCFSATAALYSILSDLLASVYDDNASRTIQHSLTDLIKQNISISDQLREWEQRLPLLLTFTPWEDDHAASNAQQNGDIMLQKLSTVTRLRYLNVQMLADQAVLSTFLHSEDKMRETDVCLADMAYACVKRLQRTATETVTIIWTLSKHTGVLGAWWFSISFVLHACLVLLGCLLLELQRESTAKHHHNLSILKPIAETLELGASAIEVIMKGSQEALPTRKVLANLATIANRLLALRRGTVEDRPRANNVGFSLASIDEPFRLQTAPTLLQRQSQAAQEGAADSTFPTDHGLFDDSIAMEWQTLLGTGWEDGTMPESDGFWLDANGFIPL